jgi:hypothetical protein
MKTKLEQVISKTVSPDSVEQKTYPCPWLRFLSVVAKASPMELKTPTHIAYSMAILYW